MNLKYFVINGKKKYCSIYVRLWDSKRFDQKTTTGIKTEFKDWSEAKQRIKITATTDNIDFYNDKLTKLEKFLIDKYGLEYNTSGFFPNTWLKDSVNEFFNRVPEDQGHRLFFVDWVKKFVEKELPLKLFNGKPLEPNSVKNYTAALTKLTDYQEYRNKKIRFEDVDLKFHQDFINYNREIGKLNPNSIGNILSRIKTFCKYAELDGLPINPHYKHPEFNLPKNETFDIYLNDNEINKIFEHDFSESESLDNARDLFIIGLRTGLRISDFLRISEKNIIKNVINITTQKTNQNLTIPIHPQFQKTLDKRNGDFPRIISDQNFNLYIKDVCEEVGINELTFGSKNNEKTNRKENGIFPKYDLVSSHTCRRSFATNLYLGGVPNQIAMKATGHKTEKQYLQYVKATDKDYIEKISKYWETAE